MATKSRVRKKNGKPVKYKPKPKGMSKTQMKKIMKMIEEQQKIQNEGQAAPETREEMGELLISPEFIKKINVNPSDNIKEGPVLSYEDKEEETVSESGDIEEKEEETPEQGPISSEI